MNSLLVPLSRAASGGSARNTSSIFRHTAPTWTCAAALARYSFARLRSEIEIYNDVDANVFSVFQTLQDSAACEELLRLLGKYAERQEQYETCKQVMIDPTETTVRRAWAFLTCGAIGFCGHPVVKHGWISPRHGVNILPKLPERVLSWRERFRRVFVENKPWRELIDLYDSPDTFFFVDPPYLPAVLRYSQDTYYVHTMPTAEHIELIERLRRIKGLRVPLRVQPPALYRTSVSLAKTDFRGEIRQWAAIDAKSGRNARG